MKGIRTLLYMMIGLLIGSVIGILIVNIGHRNKKTNTTETAITEITVEQTSKETTEDAMTQTDAETDHTEDVVSTEQNENTVSEEDQPEALLSCLKESLVRLEQLEKIGCRQLLVVQADGTTAKISLYTCDENGLWTDTGLNATGYVGANGVSRDSYEGSRMTPMGVFPIGDAFYIEEEPETKLSSFPITEQTYWVDDPESELYNQHVELAGEKTWDSAEHMIEYPSAYKYGFVVNYNMNPVEAGRGSAIFFHIGDRETLGCIATSEEMVLSYLAALDAEKQPYILIQ